MKKNLLFVLLCTLCVLSACGSGNIRKYQSSVEDFHSKLTELNENMNNIDYDSPLAASDLEDYMNEMLTSIDEFRKITPPDKFSQVTALLDQAYNYTEASKNYYMAYFADPENDSNRASAEAYYDGAMKCIRYAGCVISGIDPDENEASLTPIDADDLFE